MHICKNKTGEEAEMVQMLLDAGADASLTDKVTP